MQQVFTVPPKYISARSWPEFWNKVLGSAPDHKMRNLGPRYMPRQGPRECARRAAQLAKAKAKVPA